MKEVSSFSRRYAYLFVAAFLLVVAVQPAQGAYVHAQSSFFDTGMRLCDVDENGDCDNSSYALAVARYGAGGIAAAAVTLLAFVLFLPVRCLCNGFGGKNASYGVCPSSSDFRSYTRKETLSAKIAVFVITIPIIIGVAIGFQANSDVSTSIDGVVGSLVQSGDRILQDLLTLRDVLLSLSLTSSSSGIINNAVNVATTITTNMHNAQDTTNTYDKLRESLMIVGFAFSLALVLIGVVAAILNLRMLAFVLGMVSLIVLTIIWLSFGIHLVADKFVYDVCLEIDIITNNSSANATSVFKTGALAELWKCGNNNEFSQLQFLVEQAMLAAASTTCDARSRICFNLTSGQGDPNWSCSNTPPCGPTTLQTSIDENHITINDNGVLRTVRGCALSCTDANYKNVSLTMTNFVDMYTNYTGVYYDTVLPLVSCQLAIDVMLGVKEPLCNTLFDSIYGVAVSNLIVGIFYVAFIILMVVGYKRFASTSDGGIV